MISTRMSPGSSARTVLVGHKYSSRLRPKYSSRLGPQILVEDQPQTLVWGWTKSTSLGLGQKYNKAGGRGQLPIGEAELHKWVVACVLSSNDCISELQPPIALYEHSLPGA